MGKRYLQLVESANLLRIMPLHDGFVISQKLNPFTQRLLTVVGSGTDYISNNGAACDNDEQQF
jgi:hypothetical protein